MRDRNIFLVQDFVVQALEDVATKFEEQRLGQAAGTLEQTLGALERGMPIQIHGFGMQGHARAEVGLARVDMARLVDTKFEF